MVLPPLDARAFLIPPLVLAAAALLASYLPALRSDDCPKDMSELITF